MSPDSHRRTSFCKLGRVVRVALGWMMLASGAMLLAQDGRAGGPELMLPEDYFPELRPLLDSAVRTSPRMLARQADEALAEANRIVARSGQLPTVGANLQFNGWQRDDRLDLPKATDGQKLTFGINLVQPVFHWGELRNNTRIAELQLRAARGQTQEAYRLLLMEIRTHYLQLIVRKTAVLRAQFNCELAARQLAIAEDRLSGKEVSPHDVRMAGINLKQTELIRDRVMEDYEGARRLLAKLSGAAVPQAAQLPELIPVLTPPLNQLAATMQEVEAGRGPETANQRVLRDQLAVEKLTQQNAAVRLRPKFNFVLGVSQDELSYTSNIGAKYGVVSYYAGAQMNWPIFDGYASRGLVAGSLARQRQLELSAKRLSDDLREQARGQFTQLGFAARAMEISDLLLAMSENGLVRRREDLARGGASQADVDQLQINLYDSRVNAFNNRIDYLMRLAEFLSTVEKDTALARFTNPVP